MDGFLDVLGWVERTPISVLVRESLWTFPAMLILHALGMAFLLGGGVAICLRRLGFAQAEPIASFSRFGPVLWAGFWVALFSGTMLLAAYPAKALTNPVFGLKFILLISSFFLVRRCLAESGNERWSAVAALILMAASVFAGRFLAYTHTMLMAY